MLNMNTKISVASVLATLSILPSALAGFSASSSSNLAVYWGQGSGQSTLASYCSDTPVNIIPIAFETSLMNPTTGIDTGNEGVSDVGADIITCQAAGKTMLLSIGGATFTENLLTSTATAQSAAQSIWSLFGPGSGSNRPFGDAVVDGFDMDLETTGLTNIDVFVQELRTLMDADTSKTWMLTAAPQCVYPDAADESFLQGEVSMDAVFVQFYNNPECGVENFVSSSDVGVFNLAAWDTWASTVSKNKDVKVFIGIPASTTAAGSGFVDSTLLAEIIAYAKTFDSFGGIMSWDMVRIVENTGYLPAIKEALGAVVSSGGSTATTVATTAAKTSSAASIATYTPVSVATTLATSATSVQETTTSTTLATSFVSTVSTLVTQTRTTHKSSSEPGGIFATVPTTSSTSLPTSISLPNTTAVVSIPTTTATSLPSTTISSAASTGTSTSAAQTPGSPCSVDGTWICISGTSFQQCGSGTWSVVEQLADGTSCTAGEGMSIDIVASRERLAKRERIGRHVHRHVRGAKF